MGIVRARKHISCIKKQFIEEKTLLFLKIWICRKQNRGFEKFYKILIVCKKNVICDKLFILFFFFFFFFFTLKCSLFIPKLYTKTRFKSEEQLMKQILLKWATARQNQQNDPPSLIRFFAVRSVGS